MSILRTYTKDDGSKLTAKEFLRLANGHHALALAYQDTGLKECAWQVEQTALWYERQYSRTATEDDE